MSEHKFRCGDTARIAGQDYDIEVAYADHASGYASWMGWPEGTVEIAKLTLVEACTDEEHSKAVARWLDLASRGDHRRDVISRPHRPRAFWTRLVDLARESVRAAEEHLEFCEAHLRSALAGPPDVEPPAVVSPEETEDAKGGTSGA